MERLRDTLIAAALVSASPAFADEPVEDDIWDVSLGKDLPAYAEIVKNAKPLSALPLSDLKKLPLYSYSWSDDASDVRTEHLNGENFGFMYGGKKSREISLFQRVSEYHLDNSNGTQRVLFEVPNDGSDACYQATHFLRLKVKNPVDGERESIVLLDIADPLSEVTVGEQGCEEVLEDIKAEVKKTVERKPFDPDRLIPSSVSANIGANAGNFFPYTDPLSGQFEPFAFNERTGISAELALDWKPFGDKSVVSIGPDATLVLGVDGTGTATRVGGHLGLEMDRFRLALNGGLRGDSTYAPLDGIPYVGAELDARVVNLGENLSVEAFLQAKKDFPGNPGVIDPSLAVGARLKYELPDLKPSTIAKAAKTEKPLEESKVEKKSELKITKEPKSPRVVLFGERKNGVGEVDTGEAVRISEELRKAMQRNNNVGAEQEYNKLEKLHKKEGVGMTKRDFQLGAEAARQLGRIAESYDRVAAAINITQGEQTFIGWKEDIEKNYGEVEIVVSGSSKTSLEGPAVFAPDQRAAIAYAQETLAKSGRFEGFLPVGEYKLAGQVFVVEDLKTGQKITVIAE